MKKIAKKVIVLCIVMIAFLGVKERVLSVEVKAASEEWITLNSDVIVDKAGAYWFYVDNPGLLTIRQGESLEGTVKMNLYQHDEMTGKGSRITYDGFYSSKINSFRIGAGKYFLYINQIDFNKFSHIKVDFHSEMEESYEKEWNDSFDTAQTIKVNSLYTASTLSGIEYSHDGLKIDLDYYKFTLENQGSVNLYIKKENNSSYSSYMELYSEDKDGNVTLIDTTSVSWNEYINNGIKYRLPAGNYFLKYIPEYSARDRQCEYQFKVNYNAENSSAYETEDNNTRDTSNTIGTNSNYTGNLEGEKDIDYYTFSLSNSSTVNLQFTQPRETMDKTYKVELYQEKSDESLVRIDTIITNTNPVNYGKKLVLKQGRYYIKVSNNLVEDYYGYSNKSNYNDTDLSMIDYKIKVNEVPVTLVNSIKLSSSTTKMFRGENTTLKASILPSNAHNKSLKWTSTDTEVATVDKSGKVTAISSGECYIIATATDGSEISAKYKFVVKKNTNKKLSSIKVSTGSLSQKFLPSKMNYILNIGNKKETTITLKAENKYATIYIDGKKATKKTIKLNSASSKIVKIAVVAENGSEKNYSITVKK